jgi:hypothetical protein
VGTGKDAEANPTFNYTGQCDFRDKQGLTTIDLE